jgi:hypothetical protein
MPPSEQSKPKAAGENIRGGFLVKNSALLCDA